ncbi:MAG TPA: hypothetical protein PKO33_15470 [Pyrinomonadaceae bacterium]|nr:hypothetical protein [Pyrinomonadaceae bacterium]
MKSQHEHVKVNHFNRRRLCICGGGFFTKSDPLDSFRQRGLLHEEGRLPNEREYGPKGWFSQARRLSDEGRNEGFQVGQLPDEGKDGRLRQDVLRQLSDEG